MGLAGDKRNRLLARNLRIMRLLSARRMTVAAMAEEMGVCERTIRRDLAAMEEAYIPVTQSGPYYRILESA